MGKRNKEQETMNEGQGTSDKERETRSKGQGTRNKERGTRQVISKIEYITQS